MRKTDTLKKGVNAMISVTEVLMSEEFKNSAAVQAAMDILGNALSYVDDYCDNSCMEADQLDELIYNYRPLEWGCGATKVAVMFKDFVLKSNYSQVVEWDEGDYDEELKQGLQLSSPRLLLSEILVFISSLVRIAKWHILTGISS